MPIPENVSPTPESSQTDRKLGDQWEDWDGTVASDRTQAPAWVFLLLAGAAATLLVLAAWAISWLMAPRLDALGLHWLRIGLAAAWSVYLGVWYSALLCGFAGGGTCRRVVRRLGGLGWCMAPVMALGRLLGLNRDRIGHAFVLLHDRLEILPPVTAAARLLVLVPRCLGREAMQGLNRLKAQYGFSQIVATGGTEARRAIVRMRPQGIVAVACERDLLSGVRDIEGRVAVLAFANTRPEGPCKNTQVDLNRIEDAIRRFLKGGKFHEGHSG